jgi:hypothetical protein
MTGRQKYSTHTTIQHRRTTSQGTIDCANRKAPHMTSQRTHTPHYTYTSITCIFQNITHIGGDRTRTTRNKTKGKERTILRIRGIGGDGRTAGIGKVGNATRRNQSSTVPEEDMEAPGQVRLPGNPDGTRPIRRLRLAIRKTW